MSSLSTESKLRPNVNAMIERRGHKVSLSHSFLSFSYLWSLFLSRGLVAPWLHGNYNPTLPSHSTFSAPCCPLDLCQTREQIGSGHESMPKCSGKGSKEHICWVGKKTEMALCLKSMVEKVGWSERHRVRREVEYLGETEVDRRHVRGSLV